MVHERNGRNASVEFVPNIVSESSLHLKRWDIMCAIIYRNIAIGKKIFETLGLHTSLYVYIDVDRLNCLRKVKNKQVYI